MIERTEQRRKENLQRVFYLEFVNHLEDEYNEVYLQDFHIHKSQKLKKRTWSMTNSNDLNSLPCNFPLAPCTRFQLTTSPQCYRKKNHDERKFFGDHRKDLLEAFV